MSDFWSKYSEQPPTQKKAQSPQNQMGQGQTIPDPFGSPQEMNRQFQQFAAQYHGTNPQAEAQRLLQNAQPWQRQLIERLVPACQSLIQNMGGFRQ